MIINKFGAILTVIAVAVCSMPSTSSAAAISAKDKKKIAFYNGKLIRLKNKGATKAVVQALTLKLTRLNPAGAAKYYKIGLQKLGPVNGANAAIRLRSTLGRVVAISDLSARQTRKILDEIRRSQQRYTPPQPTPPPYQSMIISPESLAI